MHDQMFPLRDKGLSNRAWVAPLGMTLVRPAGKRAFDLGAQDHCAVVGLVASAIDECHRPERCVAYELGQGFRRRMLAQLTPVARGELAPARRVVSEPAAQLLAGRDVLEPRIEPKVGLAHAARARASRTSTR